MVGITNEAPGIDHGHQRHATKFEQVHFLPERARHPVVRVWETDIGNALRPPILAEGCGPIRTNGHDFRAAPCEFLVVLPQARQLRAAEWSEETAQEREDHRPTAKV